MAAGVFPCPSGYKMSFRNNICNKWKKYLTPHSGNMKFWKKTMRNTLSEMHENNFLYIKLNQQKGRRKYNNWNRDKTEKNEPQFYNYKERSGKIIYCCKSPKQDRVKKNICLCFWTGCIRFVHFNGQFIVYFRVITLFWRFVFTLFRKRLIWFTYFGQILFYCFLAF